MERKVITVEVTGWIRDLLEPPGGARGGRLTLMVPADESPTLWTVLERLAGEHPRLGKVLVLPDAQLVTGMVSILVNGQLWEARGGLEQRLEPGDCVMLVPAYPGG